MRQYDSICFQCPLLCTEMFMFLLLDEIKPKFEKKLVARYKIAKKNRINIDITNY